MTDSKLADRFEIGKWYMAIQDSDRGPGRCVDIDSGSVALDYPEWYDGHNANGKGTSGHCWYYLPSCLREVPTPIAGMEFDNAAKPIAGKPVAAFESGKWYKWVGPKKRPSAWAPSGSMDFMLDNKPHQCLAGNECFASFYDDSSPRMCWYWKDGLGFIREVDPPEPVTTEHIKTGPIALSRDIDIVSLLVPRKTDDVSLDGIQSSSQRRKSILSELKIE